MSWFVTKGDHSVHLIAQSKLNVPAHLTVGYSCRPPISDFCSSCSSLGWVFIEALIHFTTLVLKHCIRDICDMVAYRLGRSTFNKESTGSSLDCDSYCVGTLSKFFAPTCSTIPLLLRRRGV